ncbi:MAG: bifunctional D-glycero-beta-D-manno-heptose-7-phosphate kinase/D-glycero-beta-D-manno-heptose 1-phosphate adenylyltransferase HldE [Desulfobacterales bacterium]
MRDYPDFAHNTVLVMGDVMLDRYYWGEVARISPEAPVPVVHVRQKSLMPGGSGNVAMNLAGLGCRTMLLGVCGDDGEGEALASAIASMNIHTRILPVKGRSTTVKSRIIGRGQQLLRMDEEQTGPLTDDMYERLFAAFEACADRADAVILSDYGKGIFSRDLALRIIEACRRSGTPVFVDPKGSDWGRYRGATCITPNFAEFARVSPNLIDDDASLAAEAGRVMKTFDLSHLLVTRGGKGMSLFSSEKGPCRIVSEAREVYDVSGAGDTVIATAALAVGAGIDMESAARLANIAAGIVVGKLGTRPIRSEELRQAFYGRMIDGMNKTLTVDEAEEFITQWRSEGKSIVFTNGCFDILHNGHIKLLHAAAEEGDRLVVGLNSDASVKKLKGPLRPVLDQDQRSAILASLKCVDMVILFSEETPIELIRCIRPDVIVKGGDYTVKTVIGHDIVQQYGGRVVIFPLVEGLSTTGVIEQVKNSRSI